MRRKKILSLSFGLELFLVTVPKDIFLKITKEGQGQNFKELIGRMEQLYVGLSALSTRAFKSIFYGKPYLVFELAVPHVGEEIMFYAAVPRKFRETFEKQVTALFPGSIISKTEDYNIFNPSGATAAANIRLAKNPILPLATFQELSSDPLEIITNAFSKLPESGAGAAFQVVFRPSKKNLKTTAQKFIKALKEGKTEDKALASLSEGPIEIITSLFHTPDYKLEEKPPAPVIEEMLVKRVEEKSAKPIFEVNMRLLSSGPSPESAEGTLQALAASFSQFSGLKSNALSVRQVKKGWLKRLVFNYSFRLFDKRETFLLSSAELASIFHFPVSEISASRVKYVKARQAPAPASVPKDGLLLGKNVFREEERPVHLAEDDRRRHLYSIGQTGTGKSVFLSNLARQDIQQGKGVCVIDPHGDLVQTLLGYVPRNRIEDVIYFDPADTERPLGLNMLEYDSARPEQKTFIVNELLEIFDKLYNMSIAGGPMFEQYFRNAVLLAMERPEEGTTLLEVTRVLVDSAFREHKLAQSSNIVVRTFWKQIAEQARGEASLQNMVPYISSKFDNFLANEIMRPIIAQAHSAFNFRRVMDEGKILLVNLSKGRLGDLNSALLGLIIVGKLLMASMARADQPQEERRDFYLYIDEFQNVTTKSIAIILSEGRKYRLNLTIAHQFIGQLEEEVKKAVFGNVGSMVAFRIGADDSEFMEKQFTPRFSQNDLINIDNFNAYVKLLVRGQTSDPFSMMTLAPEKEDRSVADEARKFSREKYGRSREEVEAEIIRRVEQASIKNI